MRSQEALRGLDSPHAITQYAHTVEYKGKNTGRALAVTKWLVGQVEGLVEKFPALCMVKTALVGQLSK